VVVVPAAFAAGISPSHLDAILAHELAHIRRRDYWVNLLQLLVEALLFFNPAVWWISRRVRIEREACCDALAASATGVPLAYAAALAAFAERLSLGAQPALAATGGDDEYALLDRIKRLLVPGYRPGLGLPWYTLTALGIGGMLVLAGLSQGVFSAVALAAKVLTPIERVEQIQALQQDGGAAKVSVSGTVRTEDGAPLPENVGDKLLLMTVARCGAANPVTFHPDGRFEGTASPGTVYAVLDAEGYAFSILGPLSAQAGGELRDLDLVLRRGEPAAIRVAGPDGRGIPGATLKGYYELSSGGVGKLKFESDADGIAVLDHYAGAPIRLEILAEGYARDDFKEIILDPAKPHVCELEPTRPSAVVATAEESGAPLEGFSLRLYSHQGPRGVYIHGIECAQETVADEQGRVSLATLRDDTVYAFLAHGADGRKGVVGAVSAGQEVKVVLPPPIRVRGRIVGDLSLLPTDENGPFVAYDQVLTPMSYHSENVSGKARVEIRGKEGYFETEPLWPGDVTLTAGPQLLRLRVPRPAEEVVIDLASAKHASGMRTLVLRLQAEPGAPMPQGAVDLDIAQPGFKELRKEDIPFVNGEARVDIPAPSTVSYRVRNLAGYWTENKSGIAVQEGSDPLVLTVPAMPAGAIHGRVLDANGTTPVNVSLVRVKEPKALQGKGYHQHALVRDGTFVLPSIPFGLTCAVVAWDSQRMIESEEFRVDERNPIHNVTLRFVKGERIRGRILDEQGNPMEGMSVGLRYGRPHKGWYENSDTARSGPDGRFTIDDVNPDVPGRYTLVLDNATQYIPVELNVVPRETEYVLTLKKGLTLAGRVVDDKTGLPVTGAVITAIECKWFGRFEYYPSEAGTDQNGNFRFSNLVPGKYYFWVNGVLPLMDEPVVAGTDDPVTLRMAAE
jgi:hypothetical protein